MGVSLKVSRRQVCQENLQIQTLSKMSSISRQTLKLTAAALRPALQRNLATSYILAQAAATDPVQGLFLEKIRAYATAKKAAGGALVDATPEIPTLLLCLASIRQSSYCSWTESSVSSGKESTILLKA